MAEAKKDDKKAAEKKAEPEYASKGSHASLVTRVRKIEEYLEQCLIAGFTEVRLIHGKGRGVQRQAVRAVLSSHPSVLSFSDAPLEAGSWGATVVVLKPPG